LGIPDDKNMIENPNEFFYVSLYPLYPEITWYKESLWDTILSKMRTQKIQHEDNTCKRRTEFSYIKRNLKHDNNSNGKND